MADEGCDEWLRHAVREKTNFVLIGEAGSGKGEVAINFANC